MVLAGLRTLMMYLAGKDGTDEHEHAHEYEYDYGLPTL
jgi:hypothetical protein